MGEHKFKKYESHDATSAVEITETRLSAMLGAGQVEDALNEIILRGEAPKGLQAKQMRAMMVLRKRQLDEAYRMIDELCRLSQDALSFKMMGDCCFLKTDYEKAEYWYRRSLAKEPNNPDVVHDLGVAIVSQGRVEDCYPHLRQAAFMRPDAPQFKHHLAIMLVLGGHDREGWNLMESRLDVPGTCGSYPFPERYWHGEDLDGKHIVLRSEQGFGDTIQFMRYANRIKEMGASRITAYCQQAMCTYVEHFYPFVRAHPNIAPPPLDVDYHVNLMSLGLRFLGTYDAPPETKDNERDGIGVCWFGSPTHLADHLRTVPIERFVNLSENHKDERWYVAAYGRFNDQIPENFHYYIDNCRDWIETAHQIKKLKLVITVDTAIGHLAASLGVPTWVLLPYVSDFRWGMRQTTRTPWYDAMRLYRQPKLFDWDSVFERVAVDLKAFLADNSSSLIGQAAA